MFRWKALRSVLFANFTKEARGLSFIGSHSGFEFPQRLTYGLFHRFYAHQSPVGKYFLPDMFRLFCYAKRQNAPSMLPTHEDRSSCFHNLEWSFLFPCLQWVLTANSFTNSKDLVDSYSGILELGSSSMSSKEYQQDYQDPTELCRG